MQEIKKKQAGFTLIETIIYVALFGLMMGGGLLAVYSILEGSGKTREAMYREQEAYFIARKIDAVLSETTFISQPVSGGSYSALHVQSDGDTVIINLVDNQIILQRAGESYPLNDKLIFVENLLFERSATSSIITSSFLLDGEPYSTNHYTP